MSRFMWRFCAGSILLVLLGHADVVRARPQVPYKDRVSAVILDAEPIPDTGEVRLPFAVVAGQGTVVGRFTTLGELIVDLATLSFVGVNTLTAANGDEVFIDIVGQLTPTADPEVFIIEVETEFTGGTGRFAGATGGFEGSGMLVLGEGGALAGSTFTGRGVGTISSPGSLRKKK